MKIIELVLDGEDVFGIDAISLVEKPANKEMFIAFDDMNEKENVKFAEVNAEKRILLGAVLIPDKPIYRKDEKNGEYYVFMSKSTVRESAERYMRQYVQSETTLHHKEHIKDCCVVESWIKEGEHDKSMNYGLNYPEGTWVVSMKVTPVIWEEYVKTGAVKGFSIEANYLNSMKIKSISKEEEMLTSLEETLKTIVNS
jgi:hypothetical protein